MTVFGLVVFVVSAVAVNALIGLTAPMPRPVRSETRTSGDGQSGGQR